ncbi:MAG: MFS transporter [Henriciella sp.]
MIKSILISVFLFAVCIGSMLPAFPGLIQHIADVDLSDATLYGGYIFAAYFFVQFLFGPAVGNLSDRIGRRPIFLACLFGITLDLFVMSVAPSLVWLFIGRACAGGFGIIFGPANALFADNSAPDERAKYFAFTGAAFGAGLIIGPIVGGLATGFGPRMPFIVGASIGIANFLFAWFAIKETLPNEARREFDWKRANPLGSLLSLGFKDKLGLPAGALLIWLLSFGIYTATWPFFAPAKYGWGGNMVGVSLALLGLSIAVTQAVLMSRFVSRIGERGTALFGVLFSLVLVLGFVFTSNGILALFLISMVGFPSMVVPSILAIMSKRLPHNRQGELQGFLSSGTALANLIAPLIYNSILALAIKDGDIGIIASAPFMVSGVIAFIPFLILLSMRKNFA